MVTEIIIYKLKENMHDIYWKAFIEKSLPAMKKRNIQVLNYGFSLENPLIFHLIRSFESLEKRNEVLKKYYNSKEWKKEARNSIINSIENQKTTIVQG